MKKLSLILGALALFSLLCFLSKFCVDAEVPTEITHSLPTPSIVREVDPLAILPIQRDDPLALLHFAEIFSHPWIKSQEEVKEISFEMWRDIENIRKISEAIVSNAANYGKESFSEEKVTEIIISSLSCLQEELPFTFPKSYYNVLSINEFAPLWCSTPIPFKVYKRLYLDETPLGTPFYLDVRKFPIVEKSQIDEIITWHLDLFRDPSVLIKQPVPQGVAFLGRGLRNVDKDSSHGFAAEQGDRGLFLYFIQKEDALYLSIADAPWEIFEKHLSLFKSVLANKV